jgi:serine/threonine protein kinase
VQEYLEGGTLAHRLSRAAMPPVDALDLGILLAGLLDHLHRHDLVHCDIKPSNIGYTASGDVKLFDFGLAQGVRTGRGDDDGDVAFAGTPYYMSPEAVRGQAPSPRVDLWALAVVLYEALAGRRPFDGATAEDVLAAVLRGEAPPLAAVSPGTPAAISTWLRAALDPDPAARPASAAMFRDGLVELRRAATGARRGPPPFPVTEEVQP